MIELAQGRIQSGEVIHNGCLAVNVQRCAMLFDEIMKTAIFEPYIVNDQSEGLKIDGLENTLITGFLGLQNGDIIQTVNGQKFSNKQKAFQVLKKARTQSHIDIQLMRDNQPKTLTFPLR